MQERQIESLHTAMAVTLLLAVILSGVAMSADERAKKRANSVAHALLTDRRGTT